PPEDKIPRNDEGDHRARHARRLLAGRPDNRAGERADHRLGAAGGDKGRSASERSVLGECFGMTVAAIESSAAVTTAADTASDFFAMRNVHAYYGESYIVQGVSLELGKGEILALLGRNGAGKTSTLRTIARTGQPELRAGEIWLEGKPIHTMK